MLGADGVLVGSRLWASEEANVHPNFHAAALTANGDNTIRTRLADIVRNYDWPPYYTARVLKNAFVETWQGKEAELAASSDVELSKWDKAWDEGHADGANHLHQQDQSVLSARSRLLRRLLKKWSSKPKPRVAARRNS